MNNEEKERIAKRIERMKAVILKGEIEKEIREGRCKPLSVKEEEYKTKMEGIIEKTEESYKEYEQTLKNIDAIFQKYLDEIKIWKDILKTQGSAEEFSPVAAKRFQEKMSRLETILKRE